MSIANPLVPMIIINPNDVDAAQLFTLVHEMTHIWLGESGISNIGLGDDLRAPTVSHKELESYCNAVAAEFLVPQAKVKELYRGSHIENLSLEEQVEKLSQHFKVSRPVIARKLLDMNQMTEREYWDLYGVYRKQWQDQRALQRQKEGGAPPRYKVLMPYCFGNKLVHRLLAAAQDGLLSSQEVSRLINVPVSHFKELEP
ncbi:hypothetical protein FACS1894187_19580 [Synergistales bacterium]|nr:hypothetical protein FACS1894187_19580 [Synergistales bacterium]